MSEPPPAYSKTVNTSPPPAYSPQLTDDLLALVVAGELTRNEANAMLQPEQQLLSTPTILPPSPSSQTTSNSSNLPPKPPRRPSTTLPSNLNPNNKTSNQNEQKQERKEPDITTSTGDYDPSVVVEMLREEDLSGHLRTICNIIADVNATTNDIDVAVRRATVQCFAAVNEHARVTDQSIKQNQKNGRIEKRQSMTHSVDALTDFGLALSQMSAPVQLPTSIPDTQNAKDILQAHHLIDSWQKCNFMDDFQTVTSHRMLERSNASITKYLHAILNAPSPKKSLKHKRRSFMGMGARLSSSKNEGSSGSNSDDSKALLSPQQAANNMSSILVPGLKKELAGMLLRQWDLGHATMELEGNDVASSIPSWDDRNLLTSPGGVGSGNNAVGGGSNNGINGGGGSNGNDHHHRISSEGSNNSSMNAVGGGGTSSNGFVESGGGIGSMSRRKANVIDGDQVTAQYSLVPPDGTNVVAHIIKPGHAWEIRIEVQPEQSIVWEFRASPADKTLFSLRFNGDLMFPEAMLASQAPNAGSIRRVEGGTYYLLFRNSGTKKTDKSIDIWCSVRSPGDKDMMERREYVRSGRYVCMRDAFASISNSNASGMSSASNGSNAHSNTKKNVAFEPRMFQIGRVKSNRNNIYNAAMTCENHQGVRLWKRYLGQDRITGNTPVYIELDGLFLAVVSKTRLVYTARCDQATPFYVRWLHSQEELRMGAICELSTSWNMEMHILCRTAVVSGTTTHVNGALPHWNLVLVAESMDGQARPFSGDSRKIFFAATLPGTDVQKKKKEKTENISRKKGRRIISQQIGSSGLLRGEYSGVGAARLFGYDYNAMYQNEKDAAKDKEAATATAAMLENQTKTKTEEKKEKKENIQNEKQSNAIEMAWLTVAVRVGVADPSVIGGAIGGVMQKQSGRSRGRTISGSPSAVNACSNYLTQKKEKNLQIQKEQWKNMNQKKKLFVVVKYIFDGQDTTEIIHRIDLILLGWNLLEAKLKISMSDVLVMVLKQCQNEMHGQINVKDEGEHKTKKEQKNKEKILNYLLQLLSSPAYASKILREPELLEMLEDAGNKLINVNNININDDEVNDDDEIDQDKNQTNKTVQNNTNSITKDSITYSIQNVQKSSTTIATIGSVAATLADDDVHPSSPLGSIKRHRSSSTAAHDLARGTRYLGDDMDEEERTESKTDRREENNNNNKKELEKEKTTLPDLGTQMSTGTPFGTGTFKAWRYAESSITNTATGRLPEQNVIVTLALHDWRLTSDTAAVVHVCMNMKEFRKYGHNYESRNDGNDANDGNGGSKYTRDAVANAVAVAVAKDLITAALSETKPIDASIHPTKLNTGVTKQKEETKEQKKEPKKKQKKEQKEQVDEDEERLSIISKSSDSWQIVEDEVSSSTPSSKSTPTSFFTPPVVTPVVKPRKSKNKRPWSRLRDYAYVVDQLAEHFFQRDLALYSSVPPADFVYGSKVEKRTGQTEDYLPSPLTALLSENQNRLRWLQSEVLQEVDVARRARTLEIVIDLALASRRLRNFQMLLCCYDALRSPPILRLVDTWSQVRSQRHEEFERLKRACSPFLNYRNLRNIVRSCTKNQPYIPCIVPLLIALRHVIELPTLVVQNDTIKSDDSGEDSNVCINWNQLKVIQDTVKQFESPSLGVLGSTLLKSIPSSSSSSSTHLIEPPDISRRRSFSDTMISPLLGPQTTMMTPKSLAASGNGIHLGDFSLFTLSSPTILLHQSNLVEPSLFDYSFSSSSITPPGHHSSYIYVIDPALLEKEKQARQNKSIPPITFENIRRFAGVSRLDAGQTTREIAVEELLEMILIDPEDDTNQSTLTNPHAYHVNKFVKEFSKMILQPYPHGVGSFKTSNKKHSYQLLQHIVRAMCALSDRIVIDLEISSPWLLDDIDESFEDDLFTLESYPEEETEEEKEEVDQKMKKKYNSGNGNKTISEMEEDNRNKLIQSRKYLLKLHVRSAVTHALLGRVGLRLWAAVRRDWITIDTHLERCRVAISSISNETLWELCSCGGEEEEGDDDPWPYVVDNWSDAIRRMNDAGRPSTPFLKMDALAEVFSSIDREAVQRSMPSLTADTLIPILLYVVCRTTLKFKHATINFVQPFVDANRSYDKGAGRDLFCIANLDMVLRLMGKFPNFYGDRK